MCGIVGLFAKKENISANLGLHLSKMLESMSDRGPDSAGLAIFGNPIGNQYNYFGKICKEDLDFIQTIAFETVRKYVSS